MNKYARPSESPETRKFITEAFRKYLWKYAQDMYGYKPNDREKVLRLMQIMNTLMNEDYNLDELERGLDQACREFTEEGNYYVPPAIKVLQVVKRFYQGSSRPEQKSNSSLQLASEQTQRREQFKIDFHRAVEPELASALLTEYCQTCNISSKIKFNLESFYGDFFGQDSVAKAIIVDYGIKIEITEEVDGIRKGSGKFYT
tara:strand:- start:1721 stop:2323 length:603 start_codon:yes stop_codon:yes gene_type:complete